MLQDKDKLPAFVYAKRSEEEIAAFAAEREKTKNERMDTDGGAPEAKKRCLEDVASESDEDEDDIDAQAAGSTRQKITVVPEGILKEEDWDVLSATLYDVQDEAENDFDLESKSNHT